MRPAGRMTETQAVQVARCCSGTIPRGYLVYDRLAILVTVLVASEEDRHEYSR